MSTIREELDEGIRKVLEEFAESVVKLWTRQAPSRTDALRRSIGWRLTVQKDGYILQFGFLQYGLFVSLGTLRNADKRAYQLSPFELPPWNVSPPKRLGGIVPRYWTSLSDHEDELLNRVETGLAELFDTTWTQFSEELQNKIDQK